MRLFIFAIFLMIVAMPLPACAEEELNPEFPVLLGEVPIGADWSLFLPMQMNKDVKDGGLVLWREGLTIWVSLYDNERDAKGFVARVKKRTAEKAKVTLDEQRRYHYLYIFEIAEPSREGKYPAIIAHAIADDSFVLFGVYCDDQERAEKAYEILKSIKRGSLGVGPLKKQQ